MDNIKNLLDKIKEDRIAHVLVNSLKDIPEENWNTVLKEVINGILSKRIESFKKKVTKNDN